MFSEILKIIPRVDSGSLGRMERALNSRFGAVAKKFGRGLVNVLKGGGIAGAVIAIADRFLNPLKEVQEAIDKTLERGGDLNTFAEQFGTTSGALARLQAFGEAKGLNAEELRNLIGKFQSKVAEASADPSKTTAVSKFVGRKDMAEAFFEFIQSMQKLDPTRQNLVQQEVFGEKQILKASEFMKANFAQLALDIGGPGADQLTASITKTSKLDDIRKTMTARRNLLDIQTKADKVGPETLRKVLKREQDLLNQENQRIDNFENLAAVQMVADQFVLALEKAIHKMLPNMIRGIPGLLTDIAAMSLGMKSVSQSRAARGMTGDKDK